MQPTIAEARSILKNDWAVSHYYELAEDQTSIFWTHDYPFLAMFEQLDLANCLELACGHGRHTAQVIAPKRRFTLIDINQSNIDFCADRFAGLPNVSVMKNDGSTLPVQSDSFTSLFCYDAMVHFELQDIIVYLDEIFRVLMAGGKALLHFSNYQGAPGGLYHDNPHWRNFNSVNIFHHLAVRSGFRIVDTRRVHWGGVFELDAVMLLEKP